MKHGFTLFLLLVMGCAYGQHPAFYQINDDHDLPSNEVYSIVQDQFGFVWMGCDGGLFRYDGYRFKQYSNPRQNGRGISFLQLDHRQRLWCKNFYGQIYRVENDSLMIVRQVKTSNPSYPQFTLDARANMWMYRNRYLVHCNENGDSLAAYHFAAKGTIATVKYLEGKIYVFFDNMDVAVFDPATKKHELVRNRDAFPLAANNCTVIAHQNALYALVETQTSQRKMLVYKTDGHTVQQYHTFQLPGTGNRVYSLYSDGRDLWAATSFGAFRLKELTGGKQEEILFPGEKVSCLMKDREDQLWFGTLQNGLFVIPNRHVIRVNRVNGNLQDDNLTFVRKNNLGQLWLGTYSGKVYTFSSANHTVKEVFKSEKEHFIAVKDIRENGAYTFLSRGRLCVVDKQTGQQFFPPTSNIRGLCLLNDTVYMVHPDFFMKSSISDLLHNRIPENLVVKKAGGRIIERDEKNQLFYLSLGDGLYTYTPEKGLLELLDGNEKIYATGISCDDGVAWAATVSKGVFGFKSGKKVAHFDSENLLRENNVKTVCVYGRHLWVCTENYLHRIHLDTRAVGVFDQTNSIHVKDIHAMEIDRDTVFLATSKGLLYFPHDLSWKNNTRPNARLLSMTLNGKKHPATKVVSLDYDNNNFRIDFASTAFKSKGGLQYGYRLAGLDSSWTYVSGSSPYALFLRIPPGQYTFEAKAVNESGVQSAVISFKVNVHAPFWQRWWFYTCIVLLVSGLVALFFILRIRYLNRRAELRNRITASQLTALKSQMSPHFMFNALNSIQDLVIQQDVRNSNLYISKFSSLMRKVLDASGAEKIALQDEIEILELYLDLEKLRFGNEFLFSIEVDPQIDTGRLMIPSMILQPFVENAIKHGLLHKKNNKLLHIAFLLSGKTLLCTITDNGIGRKRSEEIRIRQTQGHHSFATKATEKRIELLNSYSDRQYGFSIVDLIEHEQPVGTKVIVSIPF